MLIFVMLKYGAANMTVETCANLCNTYAQVLATYTILIT